MKGKLLCRATYLRERTINVLTLGSPSDARKESVRPSTCYSSGARFQKDGQGGRRREIDGASRIELLRTVDEERDPPVPVIEVSLTREFLGLVFFFFKPGHGKFVESLSVSDSEELLRARRKGFFVIFNRFITVQGFPRT